MNENNHLVYLSKKNIKIAEFILAYFSWSESDRDIKNQPEYCTWRYQFKSSTAAWIYPWSKAGNEVFLTLVSYYQYNQDKKKETTKPTRVETTDNNIKETKN